MKISILGLVLVIAGLVLIVYWAFPLSPFLEGIMLFIGTLALIIGFWLVIRKSRQRNLR